jgi:hypothetical protein
MASPGDTVTGWAADRSQLITAALVIRQMSAAELSRHFPLEAAGLWVVFPPGNVTSPRTGAIAGAGIVALPGSGLLALHKSSQADQAAITALLPAQP